MNSENSRTYRVAIVGSGPSGFYAAEALLSSPDVHVDMYDRLPTPFGLVRAGIAPDHQRTKQVIRAFERIAANGGLRFMGNVEVGGHVRIERLLESYDAVLLAVGAASDRKLGIEGEALGGSLAATEFVGWYNGHPDFTDLSVDLSSEVAVVIGVGNVTADLCRVLLGSIEEFEHTDIAAHALERLRQSRVRTVHVVGRKGPADSRFTNPELRELGRIAGVRIDVDPAELEAIDRSTLPDSVRRNLETFASFAASSSEGARRRLVFHFHKRPTRILGSGRVTAIELTDSRTSRSGKIECGLVLRSIGNRALPLQGVPFDEARGVLSNVGGRVVRDGRAVAGLYVTGWAKRGPSGTVGTNRADSQETCRALLSDIHERSPKSGGLVDGLVRQLEWAGSHIISYGDWLEIDQQEIARGNGTKLREKFVRIAEMVEAARAGKASVCQSVTM